MKKFYRVCIYDYCINHAELQDMRIARGDEGRILQFYRDVLDERKSRAEVRLEELSVLVLSDTADTELRAYYSAAEPRKSVADFNAKEYVFGTGDDVRLLLNDRGRMAMDDGVGVKVPYAHITADTLKRRNMLKKKKERLECEVRGLERALLSYEVEP